MYTSVYFSLSYFAARFWARIAPRRSRDGDVFRAMAAALTATNAFSAVRLHQSPENLRTTADQHSVAMIRRTGWTEEDRYGALDTLLRVVTFEAWICVRSEESDDRWESIDYLESLLCNTLDGVCFAAITFPAMTWLRSGTDDLTERHPEQRSKLSGQFTYIVETFAGRNASPPS